MGLEVYPCNAFTSRHSIYSISSFSMRISLQSYDLQPCLPQPLPQITENASTVSLICRQPNQASFPQNRKKDEEEKIRNSLNCSISLLSHADADPYAKIYHHFILMTAGPFVDLNHPN